MATKNSLLPYELVAIKLGEAVKWNLSVNHIRRTASAVFGFDCDEYANPAITSSRAQEVYNWVVTLRDISLDDKKKRILLQRFVEGLLSADDGNTQGILKLLDESSNDADQPHVSLHPEICMASEHLLEDGHYDQAVFEALKRVEQMVKVKTGLTDSGQNLMFTVFSEKAPLLTLGDIATPEGRDRQEGAKFLFAGAMRAVRNVAAHDRLELTEQEGLELLGLASYLARLVDRAKV